MSAQKNSLELPQEHALLDEEFLRRLLHLQLLVKRHFHGYAGAHKTARAGMSLEFAEYREYYPGDDLRYVDWNLYGRLDRLFVKVFHREEEIPIYLLIDTSRSMALGEKLSYAARLAAALAYIGLKELNRVGVFPFARDLARGIAPHAGSSQLHKIFRLLTSLQAQGETALNDALERFAKLPLENGLAILLSDMLDEHGYQLGLSHLLYKRFEIVIVQVLAPEDIMPRIASEARLIDSESARAFSVGRDAVHRYRERLAAYEQELDEFCRARRIRRVLVSTERPLERVLLEDLRGVLFS
ncbi:MAG: DUF58 domain-containing protein [Candidatus Bipolaricaulota bacterium]|nr:DUF58 domain-containing protein [Candidatus Bipolaricaulota bacterium]MCS7274754.1 DUF58 domain-containing protein [Candidatus Bipolaricaulota bacterium]MDW8110034.1 DUF58 domain-containing protein [Candidatus Bipolaricaulota bacterium]MDW8328894.1 DUF58 domain-containing protein [Candidatus Bipolaricaulota bacterium]